MKNTLHQHYEKCPITKAPIPGEIIFTIHARKGSFNACASCMTASEAKNVKSLRELNNERASKT